MIKSSRFLLKKPPVKSAAAIPKSSPAPINSAEKLYRTAFYITRQQQKALKLKSALSDKAEDKDQSAIVRAALDIHLADTLKQVA